MLQLEDAGKSLGGRVVVHSATFSVAAGEILCITGESGIGKSTLLELIAGVIAPDKGLIERHGAVSLCFQDNALIPWLTAAENLAYVLPAENSANPHGHAHDAPDMTTAQQRITQWLERFRLESDMYPAAMSGGMRRRLGMARAFFVERPILLLDEPFAFLDAAWQESIAGYIDEAAQKGAAIVLTSHTLEPVRHMSVTHRHVERAPLVLA